MRITNIMLMTTEYQKMNRLFRILKMTSVFGVAVFLVYRNDFRISSKFQRILSVENQFRSPLNSLESRNFTVERLRYGVGDAKIDLKISGIKFWTSKIDWFFQRLIISQYWLRIPKLSVKICRIHFKTLRIGGKPLKFKLEAPSPPQWLANTWVILNPKKYIFTDTFES